MTRERLQKTVDFLKLFNKAILWLGIIIAAISILYIFYLIVF